MKHQSKENRASIVLFLLFLCFVTPRAKSQVLLENDSSDVCKVIDIVKVDLEEGVRKTTILRHNYIAITTKDDIPGEVEVHYSILGNNGQNEVKTPFHTNIAANRKYIHV